MKNFLDEEFLLENPISSQLYHEFAEEMPIFDYHCHLPPEDIAKDTVFENITKVWLYGDHYKWRAMRANGISEDRITGKASDKDKFDAWAETVPYTLRNPLYHWTHLELKRYFGCEQLLSPTTSTEVYDQVNQQLSTQAFSVRNLLRKMKVTTVCTTDDPIDDLKHHQDIKADDCDIKVLPTFRPDKAMNADNIEQYNDYLDQLESVSGNNINSYESLVETIDQRHQFFHDNGCRLSDHGLDTAYYAECTPAEMEAIFSKARSRKALNTDELNKLKASLMIEFGKMDHKREWTQQLHIGAIRNNSTRMMRKIGPDTGFDSIGDLPVGNALSRFLDQLDIQDQLPKTIIYNLNPRDNELLATMAGNFQDGKTPGKMQFGSGWWFLDQKDGMEKQMNTLSNLGLISRFVGMLTDSRSFLSYPRHEYFRRILCNLFGEDIRKGLLPCDIAHVGKIIQDICYHNAKQFFKI